jgi:hypothetical protein
VVRSAQPNPSSRRPTARPPGDAQHQREREVGGGLGQDAGRVAHRNAAGGGRLHVDVVDAHGVVRDRAQVWRRVDQLGVDGIGEQ